MTNISRPPQPNIHFFGIRRSGNHAVLNGLIGNPEANGYQVEHFNDIHDPRMTEPKVPQPGDEHLKPKDDTDLTIYSYQDVPLADIDTVPFFAGDPTGRRMTVVRDLGNLLASRIAMYADLEQRGLNRSVQSYSFEEIADMWSAYAQNFLDNPEPESGNVHFPLWFQSRAYRDEVVGSLGLGPNHDAGLNTVSDFGFGSSFDMRSFDGRGQEMAVLDRWRTYQDDPRFQQAFGPYVDLSQQFSDIAR